jgi:hypothetical protein
MNSQSDRSGRSRLGSALWYSLRMTLKSCFAGLGEGLAQHLDDPGQRTLFDYHRDRIAGVLADNAVELATNQDAVAGFLNGFLTTVATFVANGSIEQEATFEVLGGVYLLGVKTESDVVEAADGREFIARVVMTVETEVQEPDPEEVIAATGVIREMFSTTPDVPISYASLSGFVLGMFYAAPYLPTNTTGLSNLFAAVSQLARGMD